MSKFSLGATCLLVATALLPAERAHAGAAEVVACQEIADKTERLACFDRTVVGLANDLKEASNSSSLFGLFGGRATSEKEFGAPPRSAMSGDTGVPEVSSITAKIQGISFAGTGKPVFVLENGQVWRAQEIAKLRLKGDGTDTATVKRSMLGLGYVIRVNDLNYDISVARER